MDSNGLECATCHSMDIRAEHAKSRISGCASCHESAGRFNLGITLKTGLESLSIVEVGQIGPCGISSAACHLNPRDTSMFPNDHSWHGESDLAWGQARFNSMTPVAYDAQNETYVVTDYSSCGTANGAGAACHDVDSTESAFKFGRMDFASAHQDYWYAQTMGTTNPTVALLNGTESNATSGTVSITSFTKGCALCHSASARPLGSDEHYTALRLGATYDCDSCHDSTGASGVYSGAECYRTPYWKSVAANGVVALPSEPVAATAEPLSLSDYISNLVALVTGAGEPADTGLSALSAEATSLPEFAIPATHPVSLAEILARY